MSEKDNNRPLPKDIDESVNYSDIEKSDHSSVRDADITKMQSPEDWPDPEDDD